MKTMCMWIVMVLFLVFSCSSGSVDGSNVQDTTLAPPSCLATSIAYPTTPDQFQVLYNGRGFYADGNHLGRDIALVEGTAIRAIACGIVRIYRPASGYGTLAVVIEHRLPQTLTVTNGAGELVSVTSFLSIYGHLRPTTGHNSGPALTIHVGDMVAAGDVIGYVQNDADNGDGAEHLHFGIRLQTQAEAQQIDANWFRGYDATPSQRRWFADPQDFLPTVMRSSTPVRAHPAGTVMTASGQYWMLDENELLRPMDAAQLRRERLQAHVITVAPEEVRCYATGSAYQSFLTTDRVEARHFAGSPAVYEIDYTTHEARAFISHDAFASWGWTDQQIVNDAGSVADFLRAQQLADRGYRRLRDGVLVKGVGQSEVAVVSNGQRLPMHDWATFIALGYQNDWIVTIDPSVLDAVAFPRGAMLTAESIAVCQHPGLCLTGDCDAGHVGGGLGEELDAGSEKGNNDPVADVPTFLVGADVPSADVVMVSDVGMPVHIVEVCNGLDDDGNGLVDETFLCPLGHHGAGCVTSCGSNGFRLCVAPTCSWGDTCTPYPESCDNIIDDDCDGHIDCDDTDCLMSPVCLTHAVMLTDASMPMVDVGLPQIDASLPPSVDAGPDVTIGASPDAGMSGVRYEFRVLETAGWSATSPYYLRDLWWSPVVCQNTGTTTPESRPDGWQRCDLNYHLSPFVGSFFSPPHTDWGDHGQLGTVGNAPMRCTPTDGVEWQITELPSGRDLFHGPAALLPCAHVGSQDRHALP